VHIIGNQKGRCLPVFQFRRIFLHYLQVVPPGGPILEGGCLIIPVLFACTGLGGGIQFSDEDLLIHYMCICHFAYGSVFFLGQSLLGRQYPPLGQRCVTHAFLEGTGLLLNWLAS
jgi:hypothetical protein